MTMKKTFAVLIICLFLAVGCATPRPMSSTVNLGGSIRTDAVVQELHVSKTEENRPELYSGINFSCIPLVPFWKQEWSPETLYEWKSVSYNFPEDLSKTVANDLRAAGLANIVTCDASERDSDRYFSKRSSLQQPSSTNRIDLFLKEAVWNRYYTTYGLSLPGTILWLVGFPVSYGNTHLEFEAVVFAPDGKELGRRTFESRLRSTEWLYTLFPLPKKLPLMYEEISPELRNFVKECLRKSPVGSP